MRTSRNIPGLMADFPMVINSLFNDEILRPTYGARHTAKPALNILENENSYGIELAAPGFEKQDFEIAIENNQLIISAEKSEEKKEESITYTLREFVATSFKRKFTLPENQVNEDAIEANYENGVLKVLLPKREEAKPKAPKQIAIQ
jgi:HSP20 family protein